MQKHPEREGDSPLQGPFEARQVPADDKRQRLLTRNLNHFYDAVVVVPHDSSLVLYGPGEAKTDVQVDIVETADKMTKNQLLAKVRAHYATVMP